MNTRKTSLLSLSIVILLSLLGAVYAHWSDVVTIEGTINMGSLTLSFDYVEPPDCNEYHWNEAHDQLIAGEYLGKDVGNCTAYYTENITDPHTGKEGYKKLIIVVDNAYPQYIVGIVFKLHNIGTIPIKIIGYNITGEKRNATGHKIYNLLWQDDGDGKGSIYEDVNGNGVVDAGDIEVINLEVTDSLPTQIDPCKKYKAEIDLEFKQEAEECHTYILIVEIIGIQWNKS